MRIKKVPGCFVQNSPGRNNTVVPRYHPLSASPIGAHHSSPLNAGGTCRPTCPTKGGHRTAGSGVLRISRFAPAGLSVGGPLPLCCAARERSPSMPLIAAIIKPSIRICQGYFSFCCKNFFTLLQNKGCAGAATTSPRPHRQCGESPDLPGFWCTPGSGTAPPAGGRLPPPARRRSGPPPPS